MIGDLHSVVTPDAPTIEPAELFSDLDLQILGMIADGWSLDTVARRVNVSSRTVRRHTLAMCTRLGTRAPIQAAVWAARRGLI